MEGVAQIGAAALTQRAKKEKRSRAHALRVCSPQHIPCGPRLLGKKGEETRGTPLRVASRDENVAVLEASLEEAGGLCGGEGEEEGKAVPSTFQPRI